MALMVYFRDGVESLVSYMSHLGGAGRLPIVVGSESVLILNNLRAK